MIGIQDVCPLTLACLPHKMDVTIERKQGRDPEAMVE